MGRGCREPTAALHSSTRRCTPWKSRLSRRSGVAAASRRTEPGAKYRPLMVGAVERHARRAGASAPGTGTIEGSPSRPADPGTLRGMSQLPDPASASDLGRAALRRRQRPAAASGWPRHDRDARLQRGPHPRADVRGRAPRPRRPGDPRRRRLARPDRGDRPPARPRGDRPPPEPRLRRQPEDLLRRGARSGRRRRGHAPSRLPVRRDPDPGARRADPARRDGPHARQPLPGRSAGRRDAALEVRQQPLPDHPRERRLRPPPVRVPHGLPGVLAAPARDDPVPPQQRRLRLRPGARGPGRGGRARDRRDRRPDPVLRRGQLGRPAPEHRLRALDAARLRAVRAPPDPGAAVAEADAAPSRFDG